MLEEHAFVTGENGQGIADLNSLISLAPGDYFTNAEGINNAGQIIASDIDGQGYLLTPKLTSNLLLPSLLNTTAVPEPENALLIVVGIATILLVRRRNFSIFAV